MDFNKKQQEEPSSIYGPALSTPAAPWENVARDFFDGYISTIPDYNEQIEMLNYFHYRLRQEYERWLNESIERKEQALTSIENAENALKRLLQ